MMTWLSSILLVGLLLLGLTGCDSEKTVMWNDYPIHIKEVKLHEPKRIDGNALLLDDGRIYIGGGAVGLFKEAQGVELLDPKTGEIEFIPQFIDSELYRPSIKLQDGRIFISQRLDRHLIFDPATKQFTPTGLALAKSHPHPNVVLEPEGTVLIFPGNRETLVERYDPGSNSFSKAGELAYPVFNNAAFMVNDHEVLLTGGFLSKGEFATGFGAQVFNTQTGKKEYLPLDWPGVGLSNSVLKLDSSLHLLSNGERFAWVNWPELKPIENSSELRTTSNGQGFTLNNLCDRYVVVAGKQVYRGKKDQWDIVGIKSSHFSPFIKMPSLMSPSGAVYAPGKFFIQSGHAGKAFLVDASSLCK
jgi:hypothetical protein